MAGNPKRIVVLMKCSCSAMSSCNALSTGSKYSESLGKESNYYCLSLYAFPVQKFYMHHGVDHAYVALLDITQGTQAGLGISQLQSNFLCQYVRFQYSGVNVCFSVLDFGQVQLNTYIYIYCPIKMQQIICAI